MRRADVCWYKWRLGGLPYFCTLPSKHDGPHRDRYSTLTHPQKKRRRRRAADKGKD